jgi:hypothetical protein
MAKNKISEYSATASNNTDIGGINISEGCAPSGINNAIRELMAQLKDQQTGTDADSFVVGGAFTCTGAAVFSSTVALGASATATTQSAGDNSTKVATTAYVGNSVALAYPIGSIYINATNSTNPATLFGFGTWVAFSVGRVMVGFDASDSFFNSAEKTGGSNDAIVPSHTHSISDTGHSHGLQKLGSAQAGTDNGGAPISSATGYSTARNLSATENASTGITISTTGDSPTNANVQKYITVYMWKRTA